MQVQSVVFPQSLTHKLSVHLCSPFYMSPVRSCSFRKASDLTGQSPSQCFRGETHQFTIYGQMWVTAENCIIYNYIYIYICMYIQSFSTQSTFVTYLLTRRKYVVRSSLPLCNKTRADWAGWVYAMALQLKRNAGQQIQRSKLQTHLQIPSVLILRQDARVHYRTGKKGCWIKPSSFQDSALLPHQERSESSSASTSGTSCESAREITWRAKIQQNVANACSSIANFDAWLPILSHQNCFV